MMGMVGEQEKEQAPAAELIAVRWPECRCAKE
jgi:hypothetical protein